MPERQMRKEAEATLPGLYPLAIKRHVCTWVFREVCDHLPKRMPA